MTYNLPAGGSVTTLQLKDQETALELRNADNEVTSFTVMSDEEAMDLVGQIGANL